MKVVLTSLFIFCSAVSFAQTSNELAVNIQSGYSKYGSANASLMLGVQASNNTQGFIGVTYKRFIKPTGHSQNYVGLKAHAQSTFENTGITPFIEVFALKGEYYTYTEVDDKVATVQKAIHIGGVLGAGYMFNDNIGLFAGYSFIEYRPSEYSNFGKSPYLKGAISIKASYSIPLRIRFNGGNVQRRMH